MLSENAEAGCATTLNSAEEVANSCYNTVSETTQTTETERLNGVFSIGYELDTHSVSYTKLYLTDAEDESEFGIMQSPNGSNLKLFMVQVLPTASMSLNTKSVLSISIKCVVNTPC